MPMASQGPLKKVGFPPELGGLPVDCADPPGVAFPVLHAPALAPVGHSHCGGVASRFSLQLPAPPARPVVPVGVSARWLYPHTKALPSNCMSMPELTPPFTATMIGFCITSATTVRTSA